MARYFDEWGHHLGYCNECGEEAELGQEECCLAGEIVQHDDDEVEF